MKKVLIDTNVILDICLKRKPFYEDTISLFSLIDKKVILAHLTATTITDIYYLSKRENGHEQSIKFLEELIDILEVLGINKSIIVEALNSGTKDFEDAIQEAASSMNSVETIITRNKRDFKGGIEVLTPKEFLTKYSIS